MAKLIQLQTFITRSLKNILSAGGNASANAAKIIFDFVGNSN